VAAHFPQQGLPVAAAGPRHDVGDEQRVAGGRLRDLPGILGRQGQTLAAGQRQGVADGSGAAQTLVQGHGGGVLDVFQHGQRWAQGGDGRAAPAQPAQEAGQDVQFRRG